MRVNDLTLRLKKDKRPILDHVFADFRVGQVTALIGKSGAGKSTFLNYLSGRFHSSSIETVNEEIDVLVGKNSSFIQKVD